MTWIVEQLVKELKEHPFTLLIVLGLVGYAFFTSTNHASASELEKQSSKLDKLLTLNVAATIRDLRKEQCDANGNAGLLDDTIESYQQQYIEITGKRYPLPPCEPKVAHNE